MPSKKIIKFGECPKCQLGDLELRKSKRTYARYIKCSNQECEKSYPLPRAGKIESTDLTCPISELPILMIIKKGSRTPYFWSDKPHFGCRDFNSKVCRPIIELEAEFKELGVYGY